MPSQKRITIAGDELRFILMALKGHRHVTLRPGLMTLDALIAKLEKCEKLEGVTEA